ncbi:predicted protein [Sclerotinia sclerotiorum 1980 UF-70]|uniref:Uncharacterized protein n=1 Tax=Sclerotinia sclerotiorum (strain ATCC 18683 / 1980 / Ss-1) TaxID=665079 RepID=A7F766_SCLS1|nr:predicted protein [Sclerotinia sclerotiorum 1980 UF-70]EDN98587.1 predicted protein [Sclerotinia sclerotiorum 1980 UF-70]
MASFCCPYGRFLTLEARVPGHALYASRRSKSCSGDEQ